MSFYYERYKYTLICYKGHEKYCEGTDYLITAVFKFLELRKIYNQINIEYKKYPNYR